MSSLRVCSIVLVATVAAAATATGACVDPYEDLDVSDTEQAIVAPEGQGIQYQGIQYQGIQYQGIQYQGIQYQDSRYSYTEVSGASLNGSPFASGTSLYKERAISVWRALPTIPAKYEQRLPDRICTWDSTRTSLIGCSIIPAGTPSPLAGVTFNAKFRKVQNNTVLTFNGKVRIRAVAGSVARDTSVAMHRLAGHDFGSLPGASNANWTTVPCDNPKRCHLNNDLWTYDLELLDSNGTTTAPFCGPNVRAIAVPGAYAPNGEWSPSSTQFTFACTSGTIAKCTRWGYRSFGNAQKSDSSSTSLVDYHKACVRAATADYCSNGNSFTQNGTLVDIFDYDDGTSGFAPSVGLVPSIQTTIPGATAFSVTESMWDRLGAAGVEIERYAELESTIGAINDPVTGCPTRFSYSETDDVGMDWDRPGGYATPYLLVSSSTSCQHAETTRGKWLHEGCSECTNKVTTSTNGRGVKDLEYCTDPTSSKGWDANCVARAALICPSNNYGTPMASHSECATGAALPSYATGCTTRVCATNPSCCSGTWDAACVTAANNACPGFSANGASYSFCGFSQSPPPQGL